jgi:hypothetical protein
MEELFDAMLAKGKSNMFKTFPSIAPKKLLKLQQEHMDTTPKEKRDILKRKAEEEERARRAKEEEKKLAEEARLRAQQEQLRIAEEKRIKREQVLAKHLEQERTRLKVEKQRWYTNYLNNMKAAGYHNDVMNVWNANFGMSPEEYINNPRYNANGPIRGYGIDIVPPYQFVPKTFQEGF